MNCTVVNLLASISRTFNCLINEIRLLKYTMIPYYDMMFKKKTNHTLLLYYQGQFSVLNERCMRSLK